MADKNKKDQSSGNLDAASSNIWVRGTKLLLERLGKKAGERLGASEMAERLFTKVEGVVGSQDLARILEGAAFAVPVLLQDTIFARLIQRGFRLNPDLARELSNEGLDSLLESFFDKVRTARGKNGKDQNRALMDAAREFEEEAKNLIVAKHPELLEDVLHVLATNRAHKPGCTLVREGGGVVKRNLYEVMQLDGEMTRECTCVGASTDPPGSFQHAYRRLGLIERGRMDELLAGPFKDIRKQVLAHMGELRKVSAEDLRTVLETENAELQRERFIALLGLTIEKPKSPIDRVTDYAQKGLDTVLSDDKRKAFNKDASRAAAGQRTVNRALDTLIDD
jgi:hypothetical protein